jgi:hypothetical protein
LQQFLATSGTPDQASGGPRAQLPWDLLIVDEAHNLLPSPFGDDNLFVLEVVKAWTDPAQKQPKTIHHHGYGKFAVDGEMIKLKSRMP